jgi:SAM-dependent methyltransferase
MFLEKEKCDIWSNLVVISCPVCESGQLKVFFTLLNMPVFSNILRKSQLEALNCLKGDIKLAFCSRCGYIYNIAFDTKLVNYEQQVYEKSLDYSPRFRDYSRSLARGIIERYKLLGKNIIEVGCGNGNFLRLLCKFGNNFGVGFDPSNIKRRVAISEKSLHAIFIQDYYSKKYSHYPADLIVCRQTLEHIPYPRSFLDDLRSIIGDRLETDIFFEVPNALSILRHSSCWDVIYEHCSYFTPDSLAAIFTLSNFNVCEITESFGGQFLCVYAKPNCKGKAFSHYQPNSGTVASYVSSLNTNWQSITNALRFRLDEIKKKKRRCVVWGAGSKAVTFLNVFKDSPIEYSVDINPHLQCSYIAGTGQEIVSPEFLSAYSPDLIIVMNSIYSDEIALLTRKLGIVTQLIHL